jgi:hypothetical protein
MTKSRQLLDLDRAERREYHRILAQLAERGIDPIGRSEMAIDLVRLTTRACELRKEEKTAVGSTRMQLARASTAIAGEIRLLRTKLLGISVKDRDRAPPPPSDGEIEVAAQRDEATRRWRAYLYDGDRSLSDAELTRRYGEPSWEALLYADQAEEAEGERQVAAYNGAHRQLPK